MKGGITAAIAGKKAEAAVPGFAGEDILEPRELVADRKVDSVTGADVGKGFIGSGDLGLRPRRTRIAATGGIEGVPDALVRRDIRAAARGIGDRGGVGVFGARGISTAIVV